MTIDQLRELRQARPFNPFVLPGGFPCKAYPTIDLISVLNMNSAGAYSIGATVPNNTTLNGATVYSQVFPLDNRANLWGSSASNYLRLHIGL